MKKIYSLILVAASLAVAACQPKELDDIVPDVKPDVKSVKITATIEDIDATKVEYAISDDAIKPAWEVNDELFGFDANGGKFTYVVTEVDATTGEATIEPKEGTYTPEEGTVVYGIYYPGKGVDDISDGALAIDLAGQSGTLGTASPAIMCATATVTGNEIRFKFLNQTAIIGLKKIQVGSGDDLQANAYVKQIAIEGVVTHGKLSVDGGEIKLTPGTKASTVYAVPATSSWLTDENGQIDFGAENPVAFAVLPSAHVPTVYAYTATAAFKNGTPMSTKEMAAGHYYYMSKKLDESAEPVASLTVGDVTSKYYSVSDAFDAADCSNANCSVKLLANCATTRTPNIRSSHGTGDITIDLNGKTLTMTQQFGVYDTNITICDNSSSELASQGKITSDAAYPAFYFSGSSLTLAGGTLENTANSQYALYLTGTSKAIISGGCVKSTNYRGIYQGSGCDLTMTGGKVEAHGNAIVCNAGRTGETNLDIKGDAIVSSDSTALYVSAGVVSVSGDAKIASDYRYSLYVISGSAAISDNCSFENEGYVLYTNKAQNVDAPTVNIDGGYFSNVKEGWTSTYSPIYAAYGTINISAGHFTANGVNPLGASSNGTINATGGYYNKAINSARLGETYCNIASSEQGYDFQVNEATAVASVEASNYTFKHGSLESVALQLSERMANASVSPVVTMLTDVTGLESTFTPVAKAGESVTLNLDGHVINAESLSPMVSTSTDLIISENGNGEIITGGATALAVTGGTTTINGASLVGATNAVSVAAGATLTVNNGYFYGAENGDDIVGEEGATVTLAAGWYRNEPLSGYLVKGTAAQSGSESHNERPYNWTIGVEAAVVTVNGEGYASLGAAVLAANAFEDEAETVTIKLLADISDASPMDLTNVNSKPIVLDLNGHTLSTETESFITTGGTLTITDSNIEGGGQILSNNKNVLYLNNSSADVCVEKCLIKSTFTAASTAGGQASNNSIIYLSSSANLSVTGNAKIWATAAHVCYAAACTLNIEDAELTSSNYCIYVGGAANISISGDDTSFYATSGNLLMYCNSASASIEVSGGYFYRNSTGSTPISSNNIDKYTFTGGHFSAVPTNATAASGYRFDEDEASHTHATTNTELSYGYGVLYGLPNVADVNGTTYTSFEDALAAANAYAEEGDVTLKLLDNVSANTILFDNTSKTIILDLNNYTLTNSASNKYLVRAAEGQTLTVKDGSLSSADSTAVYCYKGTLTIDNCNITGACTKLIYNYQGTATIKNGTVIKNTLTSSSQAQTATGAVVNYGGTMLVTGSTIESTGTVTALWNATTGTLTIEGDSEVSVCTDGTSKDGIAICNYANYSKNDAELVINSGSIYTNSPTQTKPAVYQYGALGTTTINGGYFYNANNSAVVVIRANTAANYSKITVNGGFFNKPLPYVYQSTTYYPTIDANHEYSDISSDPVSHKHNTTDATYQYGYKVVATAGEASVDASTSEPVVTLGEARNGGVSF